MEKGMSTKEKNSLPQVIVKKVIHATRERVFDAWTKPELMNQWYVGGKGYARTAVDLRVGGKYINEMLVEGESSCTASRKSAAGSLDSYLHHGEYVEIERPSRLVFTWNSPAVQNTTVTVEFREVPDGTEVTITHTLPSVENCPGHTEGWTMALANLGALLAAK
jgi:uncharacterized protein YndB with AHSA1/START domain